ncbi:MAG TPA: histidinol-phosphatase HisJ family protein, partial [Clostridia bacterium]|nr:histidinol-phosphatase HisJ family protein [Clostridia bacterium]
MNSQDLHTHSVWDDGQNTLEEMANAAVAANLDAIGFSGHSPLPYRNRWALQADRLEAYKAEALRLKKLFAGNIDIYLGIEWDVMSTIPPTGFDYVIGSVHHVTVNGTIYSADATPETVETCLSDAFHGDADASARAYFTQLPALAKIPEVDIIGHFDLPTKFNETHGFYNEDSPAYTAAALEAMEALVKADKIFEINTGAISRGYRTTPYPS